MFDWSSEPEMAFVPDQSPPAIQEEALPEVVHVRVDEPPDATEVGEAVRVTVGGGGVTGVGEMTV